MPSPGSKKKTIDVALCLWQIELPAMHNKTGFCRSSHTCLLYTVLIGELAHATSKNGANGFSL